MFGKSSYRYLLGASCVAAAVASLGLTVAAASSSLSSGVIARFATLPDGVYFDIGESSSCAPGYDYKLDSAHPSYSALTGAAKRLWESGAMVTVTYSGSGCSKSVSNVSY